MAGWTAMRASGVLRPQAVETDLGALLAEYGSRFHVWRDESGRKVPYRPGGGNAKSNDPTTWVPFEVARAALAAGKYTGLAFQLGELPDGRWIVGIDLDLCRNADGSIHAWAADILRRLPTYAEISPSGSGVKLLGIVEWVPDCLGTGGMEAGVDNPEPLTGHETTTHKKPEIGLYPARRFFALTGRRLECAPDELCDITEAFARLALELRQSTPARAALAVDASDIELTKGTFSAELLQRILDHPVAGPRWRNDDRCEDRSRCDFRLAEDMTLDFDQAEIEAAIRQYPYGQIGSGKLTGYAADRQIRRLIAKARASVPPKVDASALIGERFDPETGEVLEGEPPSELSPNHGSPHALPVVVGEEYRGLPKRQMVVKGLLGVGELSITYGAPKTGKSFLLTSMALAVACGDGEWFGHRIKRPGLVVYCTMEGSGGFPNRLAAWARHAGRTVPELFAYVPVRLRFLAPEGTRRPLSKRKAATEDVQRLMTLVGQLEARTGAPCVLLVVDTVARAMTGRDENSSQDMSEFIDACGDLQALPNRPHVALVHHENKNGTIRGSGVSVASGDTLIRVQRGEEGRTWAVDVSKDDADGKEYAFELRTVTLGQDEDGDDITSCVVIDEGPATKRPPEAKPPTVAEIVTKALHDAIAADGIKPPHGYEIPAEYVVSGDWWRGVAVKRINGETEESRAAAFRKARKQLTEAGKIAGAGPFVWLTDAGAQSSAQMARKSKG